MNEQHGNILENKGSAFSGPRQGGNVIENKGSYAAKPGMLLKRRVVSRLGKNRCQVPGVGSGFRSQEPADGRAGTD
jgi:hypothetical protein